MKSSANSSLRGRQLRLKLAGEPSAAREDFIVSASNRAAVDLVDAWPAWPGRRLALVGPEGSGKSHLGRAWAYRAGALIMDASSARHEPLTPSRAVLFENADRRTSDDDLFHLFNMADGETSLLLTARSEPRAWSADLPDLRSRLNAIVVAALDPPDDTILEGVLRKLFRDRHIRPTDEVYPYLLRRIERSVRAAKHVVCRLDELADAQSREVTRILARQIFETDETLDLFD